MSRLAFAVVFFALTVCHAALALDKVTFATNWRAKLSTAAFIRRSPTEPTPATGST